MMDSLKCVVVDDEPLAAALIASYVEKTPNIELAGTFASAQEAVKTILQGGIDIVFLDIEMPQLNGLEFARIMPRDTRIVFTTAYDNHAVSAFKLNALDYLLKPISYEEFMGAVNKAFEIKRLSRRANEASENSAYIMVKSEYKLVQIPVSRILYVEGLKDYVKIYLEGQDKSVMTLMSMKQLEKKLPETKFLRVHRSFIVNTSKISVIERNRILFDKTYVPVSDSYKAAFSEFVSSRLISGAKAEADSSQDDSSEE
jgi:DNA-binding LytR/AlgR family response regulator